MCVSAAERLRLIQQTALFAFVLADHQPVAGKQLVSPYDRPVIGRDFQASCLRAWQGPKRMAICNLLRDKNLHAITKFCVVRSA